MSRLIDADAFEKTLESAEIKARQDRKYVLESAINTIRGNLRNAPTAQPETAYMVIGKSKGGTTLWYECSVCGEPVDDKDKYCRCCGRRLREIKCHA